MIVMKLEKEVGASWVCKGWCRVVIHDKMIQAKRGMIYCKNWRLKHLEQASRGFNGGSFEGYSLRRQVSSEKIKDDEKEVY